MQDKPQSWEAQERGDAGRPEKDTSKVHEEPEECDVLEEKKNQRNCFTEEKGVQDCKKKKKKLTKGQQF